MSNAAKLKKKAVEFEQKKQYDKALELYVQVLEESAAGKKEPEVALYNRVGDLMLREGRTTDAVHYYGKAVDIYAEGGFLNNAIALCNKVLRHDPSQTAIHYKLGRVSAQKGLRSDAKKHFLIYAERMQRSGDMDESFRALKEFADLCPDQDDIRLALAEQLTKSGRIAEAVEQLQIQYERLMGEGRAADADAVAARMRAIDPSAVPRAPGSGSGSSSAGSAPKSQGGLVFLDLSDNGSSPPPPAPAARPAPAPLLGLEPTMLDTSFSSGPAAGGVGSPASDPTADLPMLDLGNGMPSSAPMGGLDMTPEEPAGGGSELVFLTTDEAPPPMAPMAASGTPDMLDIELIGPGTGAAGLDPSTEYPDILAASAADDVPLVLNDFEEPDEVVELPPLPPEEIPAPPPAAALDEIALFDAPAPAVDPPAGARAPVRPRPAPRPAAPPAAPPAAAPAASARDGDSDSAEFVNLGDWLRDSEPKKSTRMVIDAMEPEEGEEFDFADMLNKFKQGVAENVDEGDYESHYDLGVAFREMGLVDEAVAEFQKALRGPDHRAKTYEALGQCFIDKSQYQVAGTVLSRALSEPNMTDDHDLVGVLYLLGRASEGLGKRAEAVAFYQRVFAVEIQFRDVGERLNALERSTK